LTGQFRNFCSETFGFAKWKKTSQIIVTTQQILSSKAAFNPVKRLSTTLDHLQFCPVVAKAFC
jgi:hypothetical protein